MSVTLQVFEGKRGAAKGAGRGALEEPEAEAQPNSPTHRSRDTEAEARAYLDRHRLHEFMHALFELLLRERPTDPYAFIAGRFREAALTETSFVSPMEVPLIVDVTKGPKLLKPGSPEQSRAGLSTATSICRELPSPAPDGVLQLVIRNLRGRSLARLSAQPTELISAIKKRLEASLHTPVKSQQLMWWAETLPNDTTLEDHGVPNGASLHLVCCARDPRMRFSLSGSSDGGLRLFNLEDGELVRDVQADSPTVIVAVVVDWPTMRAVSGSFNGLLHLWDLQGGTCSSVLDGHTEEVNCIEADFDGQHALSGSGDHTAKLWDLEKKVCVHTLEAGATVYAIAVDWVKKIAFGGLKNGLVRMWDLSAGTTVRDFHTGASAAATAGSAISAVAIDWSGHRALSGLEDGHLVYWHFSPEDASVEGEKPAALPATKMLLAHYSAVRTIAAKWVKSGSRALVGSDDGSLSLWRLDTHECIARFARHVGFVWAIHADWAKERAVSGAFDGCTKLWDLRTGDCLRTIQSHSRPVRSIAAG